MTPTPHFFERYASPRWPATEQRMQRMRAAILARLRGAKAPTIARLLGLNVATVRDMLREVGMTITDAHWQHGGYSCFDYRLEVIGVTEAEIERTRARRSLDMWISVDTPREPPCRWLERRARAHRRHLRRQQHQRGIHYPKMKTAPQFEAAFVFPQRSRRET